MNDPNVARAVAAVAGAVAASDPETVMEFQAILSGCLTETSLPANEFVERVIDDLRRVLAPTVDCAGKLMDADDETEIARMIHEQLFGALRRTARGGMN